MQLPNQIDSESQLEDVLSMPTPGLVRDLSSMQGDLLILGVAGKMGPTLARLARRALDEAGSRSRVIGAARFSDAKVRDHLEAIGVQTVITDLLADDALEKLPDAANVIYLAAKKFGSTGDEPFTWAMNAYVPARVAQRYPNSRIVALSTGNVYPLVPITSGGCTEDDPSGPVGEYGQSCLGKERMFQYFSARNKTPMALLRLNYAIDLRYGALLDIARKVFSGEPIDLSMGYVNVIWQGEANAVILRCLNHCSSPPFLLNLTGTQIQSVRHLASAFGERFRKRPNFINTEEPNALLSNASRCARLFGQPQVSLDQMLDWIAHWVEIGGPLLNKPTHFQTRDGKF